jgi:hypothetical protein
VAVVITEKKEQIYIIVSLERFSMKYVPPIFIPKRGA